MVTKISSIVGICVFAIAHCYVVKQATDYSEATAPEKIFGERLQHLVSNLEIPVTARDLGKDGEKKLLGKFSQLKQSGGVSPEDWIVFQTSQDLVLVSRIEFDLQGGFLVKTDRPICQSHLDVFGLINWKIDDGNSVVDPVLPYGKGMVRDGKYRVVLTLPKDISFAEATPTLGHVLSRGSITSF